MSNFISSGLIIASIGIFFGYINPTYGAREGLPELPDRSIRELLEERDRYIEALTKTREIEQARTGLLEKYNAIPLDDRERLLRLLPDHIDSVRLIIDINNIASEYGMTLRNITLAEGSEPSGSGAIGPGESLIETVGLKFNVTGSYDDFRSFLKDIETSLRLVDVRSITFAAQEEAYNYAVLLSTYRLK